MMIIMIMIMMLNPIGIFEAVPAMGNWIHALVNNDDIPSFKWTISDENGKHLDDQIDILIDRYIDRQIDQ